MRLLGHKGSEGGQNKKEKEKDGTRKEEFLISNGLTISDHLARRNANSIQSLRGGLTLAVIGAPYVSLWF